MKHKIVLNSDFPNNPWLFQWNWAGKRDIKRRKPEQVTTPARVFEIIERFSLFYKMHQSLDLVKSVSTFFYNNNMQS